MRTRTLLLSLLVCLYLAWQVESAEILRYVDTGAAAGGDGTTAGTADDGNQAYQTLAQWEAATAQDLTDAGGDFATVHCNRTNGGGVNPNCAINGFTTSEACYIAIYGDDFPTDGIFDNTKFYSDGGNAKACVSVYDDFVKFINLQFQPTANDVGSTYGITVSLQSAGSVITIDSCIIKGVCSGEGSSYGVFVNDADSTVNVYNTIVYGFISSDYPADAGFLAIRGNAGITNVYNCTVYGNNYGIFRVGGTLTVKNCAAFNNTNDFNGTITIDYCASDDGDGTNHVHLNENASGEWTAAFTSYSTGDFSVKDADSLLYDVGTPDLFTEDDDIIGTARPQGAAWDIGAFEYVSAPPSAGGQVIMIKEF